MLTAFRPHENSAGGRRIREDGLRWDRSVCGAGTHPGGGVSGNPGRNATREVLRDRSLPIAIGLALRGR
jgi:phytoene dehydrogenase-like protein